MAPEDRRRTGAPTGPAGTLGRWSGTLGRWSGTLGRWSGAAAAALSAAGVTVAGVAVAGVTVAGVVVTGVAVAPAPVAAAQTCDNTQPAHVAFHVAAAPSATPPRLVDVTGVVISNLAAGCDGGSVVVTLTGNPAGSAATPAQVLSTAASTVDPCTQQPLASPPTVATGSITLTLCASGGKAAAVSVHDLTGVGVEVNTAAVPVTGPSTGSSSGTGTGGGATPSPATGPATGNRTAPVATSASTGTGLAFTGADIAAMAAGGLLAALVGLFLTVVSRRRRSHAADGSAP